MDDPSKQKRHLRAEELRLSIQQVGRKTPKHGEPNDRGYSREIERSAKKMKPDQFDRLLWDGDEED